MATFHVLISAGAAPGLGLIAWAPLIAAFMCQDLPERRVASDNAVITESCRIVIPPDVVLKDSNGDGVIQIGAADIVVEFADGVALRGADQNARPDTYQGYGIRLNNFRNVTIRNARVSGFHAGLYATAADGLTLEGIDASDNRRAYLKSTPVAEDGGDWLWPHNNDENEWLQNYGAALCVEDSAGVTVRACRARDSQNGLLLDRVNDSKIYDNDFSFLSGWGIAMWRSSRNVLSRNALDFCVRGYSHGVYNRGQDSAGFLVFEQCCDNVFAENSATHGGDGFFGFAGREALGESGDHPSEWHKRRGNNDNLLINNDFSHAPAHGIEMTFSFGARFIGNRLAGNAICGVWGGYSQDTLIAGNIFEDNGEMGYGLERGGVNIEHGKNNRIVHNEFRGDKCGVHLWWDPDGPFAEKPWARENGTESRENYIAGNSFAREKLVFHFRGPSEVTLGPNTIEGEERRTDADEQVKVIEQPQQSVEPFNAPDYPVFGQTRPVGARKELRGRENIIMTAWGPWDHAAPLTRLVEKQPLAHVYELRQMPPGANVAVTGRGVLGTIARLGDDGYRATVAASEPGVYPYMVKARAGGFASQASGTLIIARWDATFFKWPKEVDPREKLTEWRALAQADGAVHATLDQLTLKYAFGGPSEQKISDAVTQAKLGGDHFGLIARASLPLSAGKWTFSTLSDDGVRVTVDGRPVIDNWTWHGPTRDEGTLTLESATTVEITIEHFEIDGYATLELDVAPS